MSGAGGGAGGGRGRSRGRGRGGATRATPETGTSLPGVSARECESCRSAPGIPFCRVEWSFLCTGCAAVVHGHNWIVSMPPNPNPNPVAYPYPYSYPYPFPNSSPNLNPNPNTIANADPNHVVQLSSDEDGPSAADRAEENDGSGGERKRRRKSAEGELPVDRVSSVMKYKEKRNSRNFDKTVRYEKRKVYADSRPRIDGKFAKVADNAEGQPHSSENGDQPRSDVSQDLRIEASEEAAETIPNRQLALDVRGKEVNADANFEVGQLLDGGLEIGQIDAGVEARLQ